MNKMLFLALLALPFAGRVLADESSLAALQCHALSQLEKTDAARAHEVGRWVEGYLYGLDEDLMEADNLLQNFDASQRRSWIGAYCARHPDATVLDVAREMARFIDAGRIRRTESISG
ncbi:hypothetical protein [Pseudomonas mangiferae]|uniref:DUF2388 domain-containing protein n=1 Tax=Pseudomonas mangiferae TaxID=2593654 RepID=A0A553GU26_9PSED|nr:hypothetical protein [Pseudomonas mangiferae]TRX73000.1 hypothetical protein FM069_19965 [Pseudomonas mangiferae]